MASHHKHHAWTALEDRLLRVCYAHLRAYDLAEAIGVSEQSVYNRAHKLGLLKCLYGPWNKGLQGYDAGGRSGDTRYGPGNTPWNKGKKGWTAGGRSAETRFKKGNRPHTWVPIGSERVTSEGYLQRKMTDTGCTRRDWVSVHILLWQEHHGPVPAGHIVVFRNRNRRDVRIENLELIDRAENCRRNSIHRYPPELKQAIRAAGKLNRTIRSKDHEKQDRRSA